MRTSAASCGHSTTAGVRDRTAVFIVADHGFIATPKSLRPNAILRRERLLSVDGGRIVSGRVLAVSEGGTAMVYLTDPATAPRDREAVIRLFRGAEGIAGLIEPKDYARYHLPQPGDNPAMGDLVLAAKEGYAFSLEATGDDLVVAESEPGRRCPRVPLDRAEDERHLRGRREPGSRPARGSRPSRTSTSPRPWRGFWAYTWRTPRAACSRGFSRARTEPRPPLREPERRGRRVNVSIATTAGLKLATTCAASTRSRKT